MCSSSGYYCVSSLWVAIPVNTVLSIRTPKFGLFAFFFFISTKRKTSQDKMIIFLRLVLGLTSFVLFVSTNKTGFYAQPKLWDQQFSRGDWDFMAKIPIERMRLSIIASMIKIYSSS